MECDLTRDSENSAQSHQRTKDGCSGNICPRGHGQGDASFPAPRRLSGFCPQAIALVACYLRGGGILDQDIVKALDDIPLTYLCDIGPQNLHSIPSSVMW